MWRRYLGVGVGLLSVAVVLTAIAVPVVRRSDWWNTHTRVAAHAVRPVPPAALPDQVRPRWSAPKATAQVNGGSVVVVATDHRLAGRDVATGAEVWHYQRDNATLCGWSVQDGAVVAAFRHRGGCSDVVALDSGTGQRRWYRNADLDSQVTVTGAPGVVVFGGSTSLTAFDTGGGLERWKYTKSGCTFGPPQAGSIGVAVILTCQDQAPTLALHDAISKDERWSVPVNGEQPRLLAVGTRVAVYGMFQGQPAVMIYNERGVFTGSITDPALHVPDRVRPGVVGESPLVVWTGSTLVAVDLAAARVVWRTPAGGPPAVDGTVVWYPDGAGLRARALDSGRQVRQVTVAGGTPAAVDRLVRVGGVIVASGRQGTTVYG